jgi:NADH dehydrogenase FAD-containing subunit
LADNNIVTLSYRGQTFSRLKPKNLVKINDAIKNSLIDVKLNSNIISIEKESIHYSDNESNSTMKLENDLVYIFAGGELPTQF